MTLKFYKYDATPERIDKEKFLTSTGADITTVDFLDECDLMNPNFIMQTQTHVYNANYVYCDFTKRYYYVDSIDTLPGGRVVLRCSVDVLYTFKNEILNSYAWVEVSADRDEDDFLMSTPFPFQENTEILGRDFPEQPLNYTYNSEGKCIYMITL